MNPRRVLIAGVGNIFFGDDGFGGEVARRLSARSLPSGVAVRDFGIGGIHLAFELLEPLEAVVIADAMSRGGPPGTLYVVEPDIDPCAVVVADNGHGMSLPAVFAQVMAMGGKLPSITLVGCEPAEVEEGFGLSSAVEQAVAPAVELIERIARRLLAPKCNEYIGEETNEIHR